MKEYLKIISGEKIMYYPEFRIAEMAIMPWYEDKVRIDIELATFDGQYNAIQKENFENELNKSVENRFSNICLRLECGQIPHNNLEQIKLKISDGGDEDEAGLVQLCVDWIIYLRNITIEFKEIENQLFTIWKAESEDIDRYSTLGLNTKYKLVTKITKVTELKDYQELLSYSKEIVMREVRYKEIISKMKGKQLEKVKLNSVKPLEREFEYNDSIWAWNQLDETIKEEELIDPYK
jgi:hypothetical protein